jgi:hypothetical protein
VPLCQVALQRDVGLEEIQRGNVVLDGKRLSYGSADGFKLTDPRHLEITGRACDTLREHGKHLTVRISCDD